MFASLFRIGPLAILEIGFASAALIVWLIESLPSCYYYTLGYLTIVTFLIEMVASLRLIKKHSYLRAEYLGQRIKQSNFRYYGRLIWDNFNIITVIMLLYYSLVVDGLLLTDTTNKVKESYIPSETSTCEYTLFSLCLFNELQKHLGNSVKEDILIMWLIYSASTFLTTVLCVIFSKEYYQYCSNLKANRKLAIQLGTISEALLDCHIYQIKKNSKINESLIEQIGSCSICLQEIIDLRTIQKEKVVKLRCNHLFHKNCLDKWLEVKDHCPFRCSLEK